MKCYTKVIWLLLLCCVTLADARSYKVVILTGFYDASGSIEVRVLGDKGATASHTFVPSGKVFKKVSKYRTFISNAVDVGKLTGVSIYFHSTGSSYSIDINKVVVVSNRLLSSFLNYYDNIPPGKWTLIGGKCPFGFELGPDGNCVDKDECKTMCNGKLAKCTNTIGYYKCECPEGYRLHDRKDCEDVNECLYSNVCSEYCFNTQGSYKCGCRSGYKVVNGTKCADIDECQEGSHNCDSESTYCSNVVGGFYCYCNPGYQRVNRTHCEVHYCGGLSHYSNKKTTLVPSRCLKEKGNRFKDSCTMVCKYGYEMRDPTQITVTCGDHGLWKGGFSYCRGVKCPPVSSPPNATTYPSKCLTEGGRHDSGSNCYQHCNSGYQKISGGTLICQANGTWSGSPAKCKKVYPAPRITCPSWIDVVLPPGKNTTSLGSKWKLPTSNVNNLTVSPSWANQFSQFPYGRTRITWTATNPEGLTDTCILYVEVKDEEPPKVTFCPGPTIFQVAYTPKVFVKYKRPTFTDNVGVASVTPEYKGGLEVTRGPHYNQYYTASDKAGNRVSCKFQIIAGGYRCSLTPDDNLRNWKIGNFGDKKYAFILCPKNTTTYGTYTFSTCTESVGKWRPVGDCVAYIAANKTTKCPEGFGRSPALHQAGLCLQCPLGHYYKDVSGNDTCIQCAAGTYQDQRGSTSCKACPQRTSSLQGNHVCRALCSRGTFSQDGMRPFCALCPQGQYQPNKGQTNCLVCPSNKFTNTKLGSYSCGDVGPPTISQDLPVIERMVKPDVLNTTSEAANIFECYIKNTIYDAVAVKWVIEDNGIPADFLGIMKHEEISNAAGKPVGARLTITRTATYNAEVQYVCTASNPNGQTKNVVTVKSDH